MAQLSDYSALDVPTAAEINTYMAGEGGRWRTWTPVALKGDSQVAADVVVASYGMWGRLVVAQCQLNFTGSDSSSDELSVSLPVPLVSTALVIGHGIIDVGGTSSTVSVFDDPARFIVDGDTGAYDSAVSPSTTLWFQAIYEWSGS
jgi:hypothetical protein